MREVPDASPLLGQAAAALWNDPIHVSLRDPCMPLVPDLSRLERSPKLPNTSTAPEPGPVHSKVYVLQGGPHAPQTQPPRACRVYRTPKPPGLPIPSVTRSNNSKL